MKDIAIVPGGTGQIGSEVVKMFHKENIDVVVPSISGKSDRIKDIAEVIKCDYRCPDEVDKFMKSIGEKKDSVKYLVYMAGVWTGHKLIKDVTSEELIETLESEVVGFWNFLRHLTNPIVDNSGHVIAMGSFSMSHGKPYLGAHSMIKTAMRDIIKTVANEHGPGGLRANMIAPSIVCTDTEKGLYPSVDECFLVPVSAIIDCMHMMCFTETGRYINGQMIGMCSPWHRYLKDRVKDLKSRGCNI